MTARRKPTRDQRGHELVLIHAMAKRAGLEGDAYRAMLERHGGKPSAGDMDGDQREAVIQHLRGALGQPRRSFPRRPHNTDVKARARLQKVEALLADAGRPWQYAEATLSRMTKGRKTRLAFASEAELVAVVSALEVEARKRLKAALADEIDSGRHGDAVDSAKLVAYAAVWLFDFDLVRRELFANTEVMSGILRWLRGEIAPSCAWPRER